MKLRKTHGLEPRSKTALISDWLRFRCHSAAGVNDLISEGSIGGVDQAATKALSGGAVTPYADRGWITPDGTTGSYNAWSDSVITAAVSDMLALNTLEGIGGMLIMVGIKWGTANTVSNEELMEYGLLANASGGWGITLNGNSAANQNIRLKITQVGSTAQNELVEAISLASVVDVENSLFMYIDCKNYVNYIAKNGDWANAKTRDMSSLSGAYPVSVKGTGSDGLGIMTGINSLAQGTTPINNENAGGDMAFNNLTFIRFEQDMIAESGVLARACSQLATSPREIPSILNGY